MIELMFHFLYLQVRVQAADGGSPALTSTATVNVDVQRNLFSPVFTDLIYEVTVLETQSLGVGIVTVAATDADTKVGQIKDCHYFSVFDLFLCI